MSQDSLKCLPLVDFNANNLCAYLENDRDRPRLHCIDPGYGQFNQLILNPDAAAWKEDPDLAIVWTQPQLAIESFARILKGESATTEELEADVRHYIDLLLPLAERTRFVLVVLWVTPPERRNHSLFDLRNSAGIDRALMQMNLSLTLGLASHNSFYLLNSSSWLGTVGKEAFSPKLWHLAKIPYSNLYLLEATRAIKSAIQGIAGLSRKLILVDLDNTLWGGVVGDDGKENLRLGGHDGVGEAFVDFQNGLLQLKRRGVLLGIVSKNEETVALDAIENHPEMVLRSDSFAGWRINWQDKAANIADLVDELNLGLDSVVFIDDNPVERDRVGSALPDVLVPDWPDDPLMYASVLSSLGCFNDPEVTEEDRSRASMYTSQRQRSATRRSFESVDDWLGTLDTVVSCQLLDELSLARAAQLLNKTNQMNMATRRMSESEFWKWAQQKNRRVWTVRVADKMGDLGITGILSLEFSNTRAEIIDFVLSCRVMGRRIEETLVSIAHQFAREQGLAEIVATPIPTKKNAPCMRFWQDSGLGSGQDKESYSWSTDRTYDTPSQARLEFSSAKLAE